MAGTQWLKVYAVQGENGAQAVVRGKLKFLMPSLM